MMNIPNEESSKEDKNCHKGHRKRLRKRLSQVDFVNADDYQTLEYLLQIIIPRKDTNELGHRLIDCFGSFANVCDASVEQLLSINGIGEQSAYFLSSLPAIFRNYKLSKQKPKQNISAPKDFFNYLGEAIHHLPKEEVYAICLDNGNNVINQKIVAIGGKEQVALKINDIVNFAISCNAKKVILSHNHPTSSEEPSLEDDDITMKIHFALAVNDISLYDHIIVNYQGNYFSYAQQGKLNFYKNGFNNVMRGQKNENE